MSYRIQNSTTAYKLMFLMVQSADHLTALTGASPTVTLSKNGAAFASPAGAVTELANGWYLVAGNATDSNTLGPLALHATAASGDPTDMLFEVTADDLTTATIALVTTTTTVTNQLTAAAIATGIWQDATAGDFTVASSVGKSLYIANVAPGASGGHAIGKDANGGVNVGAWLNTTVATPATAGVPDVNIKNMNNVAATAITTIKAVQGLTTADTITTCTTATNLTNAPTAGDFTAAMKTSLNNATPVATLSGDLTATMKTSVTTACTASTPTAAAVTGAVGSVTGAVGSVTGAVGSVAAGGISNSSFTADTGRKPLITGTASAGAATSITLAGAVATDSYYNNTIVVLTGGTGAGQARFITAYVGATKVATVAAWATNPDATTTFAVLPFDSVLGAGAPTVAQIATAIWQDLMASADFGTASSIGALLKADIDAAISSRSTYAGGAVASVTGNVGGSVASVTAPVSVTGDLSATMKTSVTTAATAATPTAAAVTGAVGSVTAGVTVTTNNDKAGYALGAAGSAALTEGYAPKGAAATLPQLLYSTVQALTEFSTSGTTITVKKRDQTTTAFTETVNDATTPTSITQAT